MNATNKKNWMVWAIVFLAVLNVSTLATILYHQSQATKPAEKADNQAQLEADASKFSGRYFRDKLQLDSEQMDKFRAFNPVFRSQARAITVELGRLRREMLNEMSAKQSDTVRLAHLSDSIGFLHRDLKKRTYGYYLDIKNMCNTTQQKQLQLLFNSMFTNDAPMGFPGRGGPGRSQGNGNGNGRHGGRMNNP